MRGLVLLAALCVVSAQDGRGRGRGLFKAFQNILQNFAQGDEPAVVPSGNCDEQGRAAMECLKRSFMGGEPSPAERQQQRQEYRQLKQDIYTCFPRECSDPEQVSSAFKSCISQRIKNGPLSVFRSCMDSNNVEIPVDLQEKLDRLVLFRLVASISGRKGTAQGSEEGDNEMAEMKLKFLRRMGRRGFGYLMERKMGLFNKLIRSVCPDNLVEPVRQCAAGKVEDYLRDHDESGSQGLLFFDFRTMLRCKCYMDGRCQAQMEAKKEVMCECADGALEDDMEQDVEECASQAGANYEGGENIMEKPKRMIQMVCSNRLKQLQNSPFVRLFNQC